MFTFADGPLQLALFDDTVADPETELFLGGLKGDRQRLSDHIGRDGLLNSVRRLIVLIELGNDSGLQGRHVERLADPVVEMQSQSNGAQVALELQEAPLLHLLVHQVELLKTLGQIGRHPEAIR